MMTVRHLALIVLMVLFLVSCQIGGRFKDKEDGTIFDKNTNLTWQQSDGGRVGYDAAKQYCSELTLGGLSDWRVPSGGELNSLRIRANVPPYIDIKYFSDTKGMYMTSYTYTEKRSVQVSEWEWQEVEAQMVSLISFDDSYAYPDQIDANIKCVHDSYEE